MRYAWYSESSGGQVQEAGTREPNPLGLYDLHGNVWEWCEDDYDADFYRRSPVVDPVNRDGRHARTPQAGDRVIRGGSCNALAEMCRTRYRLHEPPGLWSLDWGSGWPGTVASPPGRRWTLIDVTLTDVTLILPQRLAALVSPDAPPARSGPASIPLHGATWAEIAGQIEDRFPDLARRVFGQPRKLSGGDLRWW